MSDSKKKENQEHLIPRIQKPVIRIEADKELVVIDKKIGTMDLKQHGVVPTDFEFDFDEKWEEYIWRTYQTGVIQHEDGTEERPFDKLKEEYLRLTDYEFVTSGYGVIAEYEDYSVRVKGVILTYCSERDLTLSQLDELLNTIVQKLESIVADLGLEMSVIRKITVQGYREPGIVFDVFDEMLEFLIIGMGRSLTYPESEHAIRDEVENFPRKLEWLLTEVDAKYESEPV